MTTMNMRSLSSCAALNGEVVLYEKFPGTLVYSDQARSTECPVTVSDKGWAVLSDIGLAKIDTTRLPQELTSLDVSRNQLRAFPAIPTNSLSYINLNGNPITSLKSIQMPATLKQLSVESANLSDISEVEVPLTLESIWMGKNQLKSVPKIKGTGILAIYLEENPVESLPDFEFLKSLESLGLWNTAIREIKGVKFPATLSKLYLGGTPITSMRNIDAPGLKRLDLQGIGVSPLKVANFDFPNHPLSIDLSYNKDIDLQGAKFPTGSSVQLTYCGLTSIDVIPLPRNMATIRLEGNKLSAFPQFPKNQAALTEISLKSNQLTVFAKVSLPPKLQQLDISLNQLTDIRGIHFPNSLSLLNMTGNPLESFEISSSSFMNWQQPGKNLTLAMAAPTGQCNTDAVSRVINGISLCVLDDVIWNTRYPQPFVWDSVPSGSPGAPSGSGGDDKESHGLSTGAIVGIVMGGLAVLALIYGVLLLWRRRKPEEPEPMVVLKAYREANNNTSEYHLMTAMTSRVIDTLCESDFVAIRIPLELVKLECVIGKGGCGEVYKGTYRYKPVAVKKLFAQEDSKSMCYIISMLSEAKLMSSMQHSNIVGLIGIAWESLSDLCIVEEYMGGGDLRGLLVDFMQTNRPRGVTGDKLRIAKEIANGLTYLHCLKAKVLHRDLKSNNVLLSDRLEAKLTDFGVSREKASIDKTMTGGIGTTLWMAPEVVMGARYDEKADIFSFGVILSELDTHELPYACHQVDANGRVIPEPVILQQVATGKIAVSFTENATPHEVLAIARRCVSLDPHERPTAGEIAYSLLTITKNDQQ